MDPHSPAMAGDGYYNEHSPQQAEIASMSLDALRRAVRALPAEVAASVVADYGSSQGRNSVGPVGLVVDELRRRDPTSTPITVAHVDLPDNDWSTLFETVDGPGGYLAGRDLVFPSAIGRSFYEQVLPDGSVAIGWSGTSVLWLSRRPDVGAGNLFSFLATGEDEARWAGAAAADWRTFLTHRAHELVPGGRLVMSSLASSDAYPAFLELITGAVRSAADDGVITRSEADAMTVPTYLRTTAEIEAPFADTALGLVIEDHTSFVAPDPAFADFRDHGDFDRFAADEVGQIRGWSEPSLAAALDPDRGPAEATVAVDGLFGAVQAAVRADPAAGHCDWTMSVLTVAKPG